MLKSGYSKKLFPNQSSQRCILGIFKNLSNSLVVKNIPGEAVNCMRKDITHIWLSLEIDKSLNPQGIWNFEEGYLRIVQVDLILVKMLEGQRSVLLLRGN